MSKGSGAQKVPRKRKAAGYKFPDKLPKGEILRDTAKKDWILGESIGHGGFGEIYCAAEAISKNDWSFVIKIEPHENGPLFMEKNFYIKVAKPDDIKAWKQEGGLKTLGMPAYIGSGTHFYKETKYRFLVMERFGKDLCSLFLSAKTFPPHTVYKCALQIIETLRYIHSKEYIHGDVKGANLLLGRKPGTENTVFVVDFGLACKYSQKEFQRDPKQAHNGTIEYTSCDMHLGVPTRRGDLEILGFNLLHWLAGQLPWEKDIANKEAVHKKKQELMSNPESYIKKNFPGVSQVMIVYMTYISKLKHDEEPNYKYVKDLFTKELKRIGSAPNGPLEFKASKQPVAATPSRRVSTRRSVPVPASDDENEVPAKVTKKPRANKTKVPLTNELSGSDTEEPEISPIPPVKRVVKRGARATKKKVAKADDENAVPPKRLNVQKPRGAQSLAVISGSETDELEISPILPTKGSLKTKRAVPKDDDDLLYDPNDAPPKIGRKPRAAKPSAVNALSDSDTDDLESSPVKHRARSAPKATKRTKPSKSEPKPSWKDAPGVQWQLKNIPNEQKTKK